MCYLDPSFFGTQVCRKCFAVFVSSNRLTRFNPKKRITKRYAKALKKMAQPGETRRKYKKLGRKILHSSATVKTKCLFCGYCGELKSATYAKLLEKRNAQSKQS